MKADILKGWVDYLSKNEYVFTVDEEKGVVSFQKIYEWIGETCSVEVKVGDNNYRAYLKVPVTVKEGHREQVLEYIFLANGNPLFTHYTYDCEENNVFCVHGTFCNMLTDEIIELTLDSVSSFSGHFHKRLKLVAEENLSAEEAYKL